jgi:hypothetical protein
MAKLILMDEFRRNKREREVRKIIEDTIVEADTAIEEALKTGMCDCCGNDSSDLILLRGMWRCRGCLGL